MNLKAYRGISGHVERKMQPTDLCIATDGDVKAVDGLGSRCNETTEVAERDRIGDLPAVIAAAIQRFTEGMVFRALRETGLYFHAHLDIAIDEMQRGHVRRIDLGCAAIEPRAQIEKVIAVEFDLGGVLREWCANAEVDPRRISDRARRHFARGELGVQDRRSEKSEEE